MSDWSEWSRRYQAQRRTWKIGDRFQLNTVVEPLVFEITDITLRMIVFWAPYFDEQNARVGKKARHYPKRDFYRDVRRRKLVRVKQ